MNPNTLKSEKIQISFKSPTQINLSKKKCGCPHLKPSCQRVSQTPDVKKTVLRQPFITPKTNGIFLPFSEKSGVLLEANPFKRIFNQNYSKGPSMESLMEANMSFFKNIQSFNFLLKDLPKINEQSPKNANYGATRNFEESFKIEKSESNGEASRHFKNSNCALSEATLGPMQNLGKEQEVQIKETCQLSQTQAVAEKVDFQTKFLNDPKNKHFVKEKATLGCSGDDSLQRPDRFSTFFQSKSKQLKFFTF